jgi:hypothetical protein
MISYPTLFVRFLFSVVFSRFLFSVLRGFVLGYRSHGRSPGSHGCSPILSNDFGLFFDVQTGPAQGPATVISTWVPGEQPWEEGEMVFLPQMGTGNGPNDGAGTIIFSQLDIPLAILPQY